MTRLAMARRRQCTHRDRFDRYRHQRRQHSAVRIGCGLQPVEPHCEQPDQHLVQPVGCERRHRGCRLCSGNHKPGQKPDPAASVHRDAGPSQRIQAERSQPAARLSVTQRFVAKRSTKDRSAVTRACLVFQYFLDICKLFRSFHHFDFLEPVSKTE